MGYLEKIKKLEQLYAQLESELRARGAATVPEGDAVDAGTKLGWLLGDYSRSGIKDESLGALVSEIWSLINKASAQRMEGPLIPQLMGYMSESEASYCEFVETWRPLIVHDESAIGRVLKYHLIIEHFLTEYLILAYPMDSPQKLKKMSFSQKITRSSNPDSLVGCLGPPLKTLNRIRNKFAHEPGYQLQELDLEPLADFNAAWHRITGRPLRDKGLDALTEFTWMACVGINHVSFLLRQEPGVGIEGWVRRWKESFPDDGQV